MTLASSSASRWAVSARSGGEVLTAGIARSELELVVLGVPAGFSHHELESWLHDLAGVAVETSRADQRARALPPLLHHALTGLLFSHAELWDRLDAPRPCSCAFADRPDGAAFGWIGDARVHVLLNGDPVEPQWVIVRDDAGREARAAVFAPDADIVVTLEYWPRGEDGNAAPASLEAEWVAGSPLVLEADDPSDAGVEGPGGLEVPEVSMALAEAAGLPESLDAAHEFAVHELPESLPMHQPGLVAHPYEQVAPPEPVGAFASAPVVEPVESGGDALASEPVEMGERDLEPVAEIATDESEARGEPAAPEPRPQHPVARWLARVMGFGRRAPRAPEPVTVIEDAGAPVSAYDGLLSEPAPEQAALDLEAAALPDSGARADVPAGGTGTRGLQPAGLAEILGSASLAARAATGRAETPSGAFAVNSQRLQDLLAEIEAADARSMPMISPELPEGAEQRPLEVDHEPVGAHETFAIPPVPQPASPAPEHRTSEPPPSIPPLPTGRVVIAPTPRRFAEPPAKPPVPSTAAAAAEAAGAPEPPAVVPAAPQAPEPPAVEFPPLDFAHRELAPSAAVAGPAPETESEPEPDTGSPPVAEPDPVPWLEDRRRDAGVRRPRALEAPEDLEKPRPPLHRRPVVWAAGVVLVFLVGWMVGGFANPSADRGGPVMGMLRAIGLGPAHFTVNLDSQPGGAHIEIDGKPQATRTPATLELPPGDHTVKLLVPGLGGVTVPMKGRGGEKLTISESLQGSLEILDADASVPISVSIDGRNAGYAPVRVESIDPGLHEIHFSGPGMPAWVQTVEVSVRGAAQIVARPMSAPANGIIQAQATINDEAGSAPLSGAQVYVDGELRGVTPLSIELPRGPHSLRVVWRGEAAQVQVIELPGGNQRFAMFQFGLDNPVVRVAPVGAVRTFPAGQAPLLSAAITGLTAGDLGEAWLRVRSGEGLWRRYPMTPLRSPGQLVVASVFPESAFDRNGETRWYVSVTTKQGDEYFSEIYRSTVEGAGKPAARPQR